MYLADFVTYQGDRYYFTADLRSGQTRLERVSQKAIEQFVRNIISAAPDGTLPAGGIKKVSSEVSA